MAGMELVRALDTRYFGILEAVSEDNHTVRVLGIPIHRTVQFSSKGAMIKPTPDSDGQWTSDLEARKTGMDWADRGLKRAGHREESVAESFYCQEQAIEKGNGSPLGTTTWRQRHDT